MLALLAMLETEDYSVQAMTNSLLSSQLRWTVATVSS